MLPPSQRSYIDLQQADVRSRIVDSSDDNKILEQFLREGKADQTLDFFKHENAKMQHKLKDLKKQQAKVKAAVEEKVLKGKNAKRPEESLEHVHELYRKYGQHLADMEDKRGAASKDDQLISDKRKALAGKISKMQDVKPGIGQFSEWIVENRFDSVLVQHIVNGPKGNRVVLQSPIKEKVKKPSKQLVGSKVSANQLRKEYTNFNHREDSTDGAKKKHTKQVVLVRNGRPTDGSSEPIEDSKRDAKTTRIKDKHNKVVYANFTGHRLEFSSEKKRALLESEKQQLEKSKENTRTNTLRREQQDTDHDWKKDLLALKQKRAANQSEQLDSEEIDFDDELLLNEIGKASSTISLTQERINYLEEFLASKAKKLGFYATSEAIKQSSILSRVISDQASQKIFQLVENIKKAALLEQHADENPQPPAPKKKERIETKGQPLSNFDRASEWPSSDQPYISSLRDEILAAKQQREEEREREREFEESQRRYFEAKEREEAHRRQEADAYEREKREEEQRIKREKEEREQEEQQRQEAEQREREESERMQRIEREQQERERIRKVREEMELIEQQLELQEQDRLERERAEKKKQGLGGRWDHRGVSDPAGKDDKKKPSASDKLREMNERLRLQEIEEKNLLLQRQEPSQPEPTADPGKLADDLHTAPGLQRLDQPVNKPRGLQTEPIAEAVDVDPDPVLEATPEPIVPHQDVFELDDDELEGLRGPRDKSVLKQLENKSFEEPHVPASGETKENLPIDRSDSIPPKSLSSMPPIEEGEHVEDPEDQQVQTELDKLNTGDESRVDAQAKHKVVALKESSLIAAPDAPARESKDGPMPLQSQQGDEEGQGHPKAAESGAEIPANQPAMPQESLGHPAEASTAFEAGVPQNEAQQSSEAAKVEGQAASKSVPQ